MGAFLTVVFQRYRVKTCIKRHQHIAREIMLFRTCSHQKRLAAVLSLKPLAREWKTVLASDFSPDFFTQGLENKPSWTCNGWIQCKLQGSARRMSWNLVYSKSSCLEIYPKKRCICICIQILVAFLMSPKIEYTVGFYHVCRGKILDLGLACVKLRQDYSSRTWWSFLAPDASHWACTSPIPRFCCQQHAGSRTLWVALLTR